MLYKKYHRNFVRQFKIGTDFSYNNTIDVVKVEPYYHAGRIKIESDRYYLVLVFPGGRIDCKIKIEENAI